MSVFKRGKYWVVQFNYNCKTYSKSSRSTRKRDALELERQMRQQLVESQVLGHREHIKLYQACDELLAVSKESGRALGVVADLLCHFLVAAQLDDFFSDSLFVCVV